ncbi:MAG: hypothetical protein ACSHXL_03250 [Bacteroidota bacterium]
MTSQNHSSQEARKAILQLLKEKQPEATSRHYNVPQFDADPSLSDYFEDADFERILDYLLKEKSTKGNYVGRDLIVPGEPMESAYYLQILPGNGGVMDGRFSENDVQVVKTWIESLTAVS